MAVLASVVALVSQLSFLPLSLRNDLQPFCIGFVGLLIAFTGAYSDDVKYHKPIGKEFLTKAFFIFYALFVLIFLVLVVRKIFSF